MPEPTENRILLAFFSRPGENYWNGGRRNLTIGNTQVLAGLIAERIDCDVFRIREAAPYSDSYDETVDRNAREQEAAARPEITGSPPEAAGYDTVILASPIWNVKPPMIMSTFVESAGLEDVSVLPVVTYAVSGLGSTLGVYADLLPGTEIGEGLAVRGEEARGAGQQVDSWLRATRLAS